MRYDFMKYSKRPWSILFGTSLLPSVFKYFECRYDEAADEMLKWVFCNGRRLRGLVLRRTDERALFLA